MIDTHAKHPNLTWSRLIGPARTNWSRLTDAELTNIDGSVQQLAALVRSHYSVARDDADHQVRNFFQRNRILK